MKICALILAGGLGTRLRSVIEDVPKPLAPIRGIPFLIYQLDWLNSQKISTQVILSIGYKADQVINAIGDTYKDLTIRYSIEDNPLGTGGAIKNSIQQFNEYDHYLILNGDTYATIDFKRFLKFHELNHSSVSIASRLMTQFDRYGALTIDDNNQLVKFNEKTFVEKGYINCGAYLISSSFYKNFIWTLEQEKFSFEKDILENNIGQFIAKVFVSDFYFKDIGIPEDYFEAQLELPTI
jgi:D-glycero-alpha-D-manno-heptose 1-phosphate guanylyltransferase